MTKAGRDTRAWRLLRQQCYRRDKEQNANCWLCGQPIDYTVPPSSTPEAWEPDHRFTVEDYPELAEIPENVKPSHKKCNRARGRRAAQNVLGNQSRNWNF